MHAFQAPIQFKIRYIKNPRECKKGDLDRVNIASGIRFFALFHFTPCILCVNFKRSVILARGASTSVFVSKSPSGLLDGRLIIDSEKIVGLN